MKGTDGLVGDVGFPGSKGEDGNVGISGDVGLPGSPGTMLPDDCILENRGLGFNPWPILSSCLAFTFRTPRDCRHERKSRVSGFSRPSRGNWAPGIIWPNGNQRYVYLRRSHGERGFSLRKRTATPLY